MIRLLPLVLLVGCAWRGPVPAQTLGDLQPSWQVLSMTEAAAQLVAVRSQREERTPDGRLAVVLELQNLADLDLSVQVRTVFRTGAGDLTGGGGSPTGSDAIWQMLVLPRLGASQYRAEAMNPEAATWQVEIRTP